MIFWQKKAVKHFKKLRREYRMKIINAVEKLPIGDVKPLHGKYSDFQRLRVGDYRIIFQMHSGDIIVNEILPRGSAYR